MTERPIRFRGGVVELALEDTLVDVQLAVRTNSQRVVNRYIEELQKLACALKEETDAAADNDTQCHLHIEVYSGGEVKRG